MDHRAVLLFDWTGTLADEFELDAAICEAMGVEIARSLGKPEVTGRQIYIDLLREFEGTWKWYSYPEHGRVLGIDWTRIHDRELDRIQAIDDVEYVLTTLQRAKCLLWLVTNADSKVVVRRMKHLELDRFFDIVIGSDVVQASKATGEHIQYVAEKLKSLSISADIPVFMIGDDTLHDIAPAKHHGYKTVQCKFGRNQYVHGITSTVDGQEDIAIADHTIYNLKQLLEVILN